MLEATLEVIELLLVVAFVYAAVAAYARLRRPAWAAPVAQRRVALLSGLVLAATAIKVSEIVLADESGAVDEALLRFVRATVPEAWIGGFAALTWTGSSKLLLPAAAVAAVALLAARRRFEAALLAASTASAPLLVYVIKSAAGRERPALWDAPWYWGSSFPSGHTLTAAAFYTAAALCIGRLRPRWRAPALAIALVWTALVGLSRLVLGVHWPTDVLVAACIGTFIPLAISLAFDLRQPTPSDRRPPP